MLISFHRAEERRTVVVPRSARFGSFGGGLLLLPSGRLLYSYGRIDFERGVHQKVIISSGDRGRTWSEGRIVDEGEGTVKTLRGDSLTRLTDGRIAMIGNLLDERNRATGFEIRWSQDEGVSWSEPEGFPGKGTVPWTSGIIETGDGRLLITTRAPEDMRPARKVVMQNLSRDGGRTWEGPEVIAEDPVLKLTEPCTIRLGDGRLMALVRENSYNFFPSYLILSEDEGGSWSDPEETPIHGQEICLGQLQSGRMMAVYRHVGGYAATFAWAGDPDRNQGYEVSATVHARRMPDVVDGALRIETSGTGESVLYHLHPPESRSSEIRVEAELRCLSNRKNGCGIHIAEAGWVTFYPDRVEHPASGKSAPIDNTVFRRYVIVRDSEQIAVTADGEGLLSTGDLQRGETVRVSFGRLHPAKVNAFGTRSPFMGTLGVECEGKSEWRSVKMTISNPNHPPHRYEWSAARGEAPNQYEEDHMIEIENGYGGSIYFLGQASWVQFPDGEIFAVTGRQYLRPDGRRSSWLRGCYLREDDFGD